MNSNIKVNCQDSKNKTGTKNSNCAAACMELDITLQPLGIAETDEFALCKMLLVSGL
jgi:hypothetical protein